MHNGATNTPEALPLIIDAIRDEGYEIVPISQIIPQGAYYTDHEGRMHLEEAAKEKATQSTEKTTKSESAG